MSGLRLIDVSLRVGGADLLAGFDLVVAPGAVTTVMGPSGCGKSSLSSYVCGTLEPVFEASGEVWLDGAAIHRLAPERRRVGILFQDDLLFPHLSVGENLAFALPPAVRGRRRAASGSRRRCSRPISAASRAAIPPPCPAGSGRAWR